MSNDTPAGLEEPQNPAPDAAEPPVAPAPEPAAAPESPAAAPEPPAAVPAAPPAYAPPAGYPTAPTTPYGAPPAAPVYGAAPGAPGYGVAPGAPGYPPAGYGVPPAPPKAPDTRPKTLAIIALILAIVGVVMAFIPFVNWIAGLVLLAAFIIALIALISKKQGGTGMSITALILSVVGGIISVVMIALSFLWIGGAVLNDAIQDEIAQETIAPEDDEPADDVTTAQDIVITDGSFGRYEFDPETWWYVVMFENPNQDYIFDFASIDVEAIGADGTILDTSNEYRVILSGEAALVGDFYEVGTGEIVDLNVIGPTAADAILSPFAETGEFTLGDLAATSDDLSTTVTGTVSGDFEEDQELVQITVVARDTSGQIIGGAWTYVDRLPSDGTKVQFEATFWDPLPEGTVFEAFASL